MQHEIIPVSPGELLESPVWDSKTNTISWVDIVNGTIFQYDPSTGKCDTLQTGQQVGAIAIRKSGGYIAALQNGFAEVNIESGALKFITDPESHLPGNRFNDGKCDPAGRFWAGTMSVAGEVNCASLYVLDSDLTVETKITGVSCSNGMAWSIDHSTFFFIDSPTRQVVAYDYDIVTGNISNERVAISIPIEDGMPDGMTIDSEGMLWIAIWGGGQVKRWNPITGKFISKFTLPCTNITSCTFGGENLTDLYVTTARMGLSGIQLKTQSLAGSLFVIQNCGHTGLPAFVFDDNKLLLPS